MYVCIKKVYKVDNEMDGHLHVAKAIILVGNRHMWYFTVMSITKQSSDSSIYSQLCFNNA